jgi:hypothetical protein
MHEHVQENGPYLCPLWWFSVARFGGTDRPKGTFGPGLVPNFFLNFNFSITSELSYTHKFSTFFFKFLILVKLSILAWN